MACQITAPGPRLERSPRCPTSQEIKLSGHGATSSEICSRICICDPSIRPLDVPPSRNRIEVPAISPELPAESNSFVGREDQIDELCELVCAKRMVTLTGPGGIGKTRLALRTLALLADELPNGASYVELADVA